MRSSCVGMTVCRQSYRRGVSPELVKILTMSTFNAAGGARSPIPAGPLRRSPPSTVLLSVEELLRDVRRGAGQPAVNQRVSQRLLRGPRQRNENGGVPVEVWN